MAKKEQLPEVRVMIPKKLASGAKAKAMPRDANSPGMQYREMSIMPFLNESIKDFRCHWDMTRLLRLLARIEGPISTAIFNFVQVADCEYTIQAFTPSGEYSQEGVDVAERLLMQMDLMAKKKGINDKKSFSSVREMLLREVVLTNAACAELVLDEARLPSEINIVGMETLNWDKSSDNKYKPFQWQSGKTEKTSLDIATFFVERGLGDPDQIMPRSIMEAAVKMLIFFEEIIEDVRKTLKQTGYARNVISLDLEKIKAAAPPQVIRDQVKFEAFCESVRSTVEKTLENVNPEDALVLFNTAEFSIESAQYGKQIDYTPLMSQIAGMYATSAKTPPTVLGMRIDAGSQALGNVETLIFLKAAASLQGPVNTILSRILTLACRLVGADVMIKFEYDDINLRPAIETEAFQQMRQTRILQQLSLGFISDEKAASLLKTGKRPANAPKLSGTMFNVQNLSSAGQDGTNSSNSKEPTAGDNPAGKTLKPSKDAPRKAGGASQ